MNGQKGAALILVLLVTAAMAALIAETIATVHGQFNRTMNLVEAQKAALVAEGGIELATDYLKSMEQSRTWLEKDSWASLVDGALLEVKVEDESGKLPVNSIVFPNGETNETAYGSVKTLFAATGMETSSLEALADWIDLDDIARQGGAEAAWYNRLSEPYSAKNRRLDTIGEISLVKGFDSDKAGRLASYLTVYSDGLVNINTSSKEVIMSLSDDITAEMADRLIARRAKKPFSQTSDIREIDGFETLVFGLQGRIKVKSDIFRIRSKAISGGVTREVEAVVKTGGVKRVLYWRAR